MNEEKIFENQRHLRHFDKDAFEYVRSGIDKKMYDFMYDHNKEHLDDIALTYFKKEISYDDMFKKIEEYAKFLKKYGIQEGDYVSIILPNVPEVVYSKYASNRIGAISNMIDPRTNPEGIKDKINACNSKIVLALFDTCNEKFSTIIDKLNVDNVVYITPANSLNIFDMKSALINGIYSYKEYKFLKNNGNSKYMSIDDFSKKYNCYYGKIDSDFKENQIAVSLYTSGSTGLSKGAQLTNEAYNSMTKQMSFGAKSLDRQDTFLGCIPFFSAYGSFCGMHNSLSHGWNIQMIPSFDPNEFDKLIKNYKPNNALGVPRFWESIVKNGNLDNMDLSFLKIPVTGGDYINSTTLQKINEFLAEHGSKVKLKVGYGATEFGGVVSTTLDDYSYYKNGSVGPFLPGCLYKVIDPETGLEVKDGEGELCINTPTMMQGYLNLPEETENITYIDSNGIKYYKTGDKGYVDKDGITWIIDRYKRAMMRPDGHTVHATPIENALYSSNLIDICAVVGIKQENQAGVIPTAFIIPKDKDFDINLLIEDLDKHCLERLPERDRALAYVVVDKIPYTLMGKINFKLLESMSFDDLDYKIVDSCFFGKQKKLTK